jgi:arabinogalactan oligomer/maltooligosaccharide transport system permease protein
MHRALGQDATPFNAPAVGSAAAMGSFGLTVAAARGHLRRIHLALVEHRAAYASLLPGALAMTVLVAGPLLFGLGLSLVRRSGEGYHFVGLANFTEILSGSGHPLSDPLNFWFTLAVTVLWTALNVVLHVAIGLGLALLLSDERLRGRRAFRLLLIAPWAVPSYITALTWRGLFDYQSGAVNTLLGALHAPRVSWFSTFLPAFSANVITNAWLGFPFMMVVSLGALAAIPRDLHEAAAVDGASRTTVFLRITLPLLKPALLPAAILGSIWTFNMFNVIYLVSNGRPENKTDILVTQAYRWAFERGGRWDIAAAYGTLIFLLLLGYTLAATRVGRAAEGAAA